MFTLPSTKGLSLAEGNTCVCAPGYKAEENGWCVPDCNIKGCELCMPGNAG